MRTLTALCLLLALGGCERVMRDMYDQPRYRRMEAAPELPGGSSVRQLPPDSVPRAKGPSALTSRGEAVPTVESTEEKAERAQAIPYKIDMALLRRGRERFSIYCEPCHSSVGDGDGRVPARGFPHPPSYHSERLRAAADRHFYDVITDGYGIMYPYSDRVPPPDRWAIVAYIRALQLSQHADAARLPAETRAKIGSEAGGPTR